MGKILFVANVAKEHILKFHIPTIRAFKKHGWTVDVACSGEEEIPECDHQFRMAWSRSPFTFGTFKGIRELRRIIADGQYDVIYCHTPVGGLVGRLASWHNRKKGSKVIYCAHGLHFFKGAPLINWIVYYPIERFLARMTDVIFTVNQDDYLLLKKRFRCNKKLIIKHVPEVGVNFDRLKLSDREETRNRYRADLGIDDETTALIYVAELVPNKNQTMLIDVLKKLENDGEKVCLILPGPEHSGAIRQYAKETHMDSRIRFLGWRNDIGELLTACDICTASSIREGFGINIVEAMYCGLPVIATNNRGHREILEDGVNGFLVGINDVDGMADRVKALIHDQKLRARMTGFNVEQYDCNRVAETLFGLINDCCESTGRR